MASDIMLFLGLVHWGDWSSISLLANRCHEQVGPAAWLQALGLAREVGLYCGGTRTRALDYNWQRSGIALVHV